MNQALANISKLPERIYIGPTKAAEMAIETGYCIVAGETGYRPMPTLTDEQAARMNTGATAAQVEAMRVGSMFGWNVPGADPDNCHHA